MVYTNKTVSGAMRGFGAPQVCFAYESHMDDIAAALGIDPLEIRVRNAFENDSRFDATTAIRLDASITFRR